MIFKEIQVLALMIASKSDDKGYTFSEAAVKLGMAEEELNAVCDDIITDILTWTPNPSGVVTE